MRHPLWITALLGALGLLGCTEATGTAAGAGPRDAHVIVCAPGSYMNGNECLPVEQRCPEGTVRQGDRCVEPADTTVAESTPPQPVSQTATPAGASYEDMLDSRKVRRQPRKRALLITELQALEALYASVTTTSPDRPLLMWRLAEGYVELGAAAEQDAAAATDDLNREKSRKIVGAARTSAIKYYQQLFNQYPKFCRQAATDPKHSKGCMDEVLYYLTLEYVRADKQNEARKTLLQLIQSWPASDRVPYAYFLFGEMFRKAAASDPSMWALAEQSYREATKHGPPVESAAYDRLADVYTAQGKLSEAQAARAKIAGPKIAQP